MKFRSVVLIAALAGTLVFAATSSARPRTTEPTDIVDIRVTITDTKIRLSEYKVERGVMVRFLVRNLGRKIHDFSFGDLSSSGYVTTGPMTRNARKTILCFLDYRGTFPFKSLQQRDANKAGMKGNFTIY